MRQPFATRTTPTPPVGPYALAVSPGGNVLLATSQSWPIHSVDAGATWAPVAGAPLLRVVAAHQTVVENNAPGIAT